MRNYVKKELPPKEDRVHWARMLKLVSETGIKGIPVGNLAESLNTTRDNIGFQYTLNLLISMGKVKTLVGFLDSYLTTYVVSCEFNTGRKTRREEIGEEKP